MNNKKYIAVAIGAICVVIAAFSGAFLLAVMMPIDVDVSSELIAEKNLQEARYDIHTENLKRNTSTVSQSDVESRAEVNKKKDGPQDEVATDGPSFDAEGIFEATQKVRIDGNGNVILDHDTMLALNEALGQQGLEMDTLSLAQLKDLIQVAMPGKAGSQVALIVGNYYEYLKAKEEYEKLNQDNYLSQDYDARKSGIKALRESYLGADVSEKLFSQSDVENEFMRDNFELASDKEMTTEERQEKKEAIQKKYIDGVVEANGWKDRYSHFLSDKQQVIVSEKDDAASDDQKERVMDLWKSYFSEEEREKMESLQIPVL